MQENNTMRYTGEEATEYTKRTLIDCGAEEVHEHDNGDLSAFVPRDEIELLCKWVIDCTDDRHVKVSDTPPDDESVFIVSVLRQDR